MITVGNKKQGTSGIYVGRPSPLGKPFTMQGESRRVAVKRGGRWYSTLAAIERYRADVEAGRFPAGRPGKDAGDDR